MIFMPCMFPAKMLNYLFVCYVTSEYLTFAALFADDKMPVISRLILLMCCFILYIMIRFRGREDSMLYKYVSWNEFIHTMLAKGEVGNFSPAICI